MADLTLEDISEKMRDIDFAMLSTRADDGALVARPMSNNRQVDYDGDNYFFTTEETATVRHIAHDPRVGVSYVAKSGVFGHKPFFIAIQGRGELIRDKSQFADHWTKDLDEWFQQGVDTPGLVLVKVHAEKLHYWDGMDEGEVRLDSNADRGSARADGYRPQSGGPSAA